ncbi:MAG TPA: hypothetical protein VME44_22390 [Streptosporangiaceae bacterium]|jgi:hypothetical protein|nr:hypothetical protein [Streptosporangiaceae bacterium]
MFDTFPAGHLKPGRIAEILANVTDRRLADLADLGHKHRAELYARVGLRLTLDPARKTTRVITGTAAVAAGD